jgi:hypothetical protein
MQDMHKGKLYICYTRSFTTNIGNQPHTQSSQKAGSSRGGEKGSTPPEKSKGAQNPQAPPKLKH